MQHNTNKARRWILKNRHGIMVSMSNHTHRGRVREGGRKGERERGTVREGENTNTAR